MAEKSTEVLAVVPCAVIADWPPLDWRGSGCIGFRYSMRVPQVGHRSGGISFMEYYLWKSGSI